MGAVKGTEDDQPLDGFAVFAADPDLVRPLVNPGRMRIYVEAVRGPVSAKELAERFEEPLARISYHVKALANVGLLRPVRRTQRRGAIETHYRAIATLNIDDDTLRRLPDEVQAWLFRTPVRAIAEDVDDALVGGAFHDEDTLITRGHFRVTAEGRERLHAELVAMYERLAELERELSEEAASSPDEVIPLNVVLMQYRGERRAGRNMPYMVTWDRGQPALPAIPEE